MKSKKRGIFTTFMLGLNGLAVLGLLLSYLSPYVDPQSNSYIAFFGLAYPPLLLVNGLFIAFWLLVNFRYALLSFIIILIGWNSLSNHIGFHSSKKQRRPDSTNIRMMTYNVHNFQRYGATHDGSTRHEILEIINQQQPDIIGIQEFYTRKRGKYAMSDSIQKILNSKLYYFLQVNNNPNDALGIALFTKLPITNQGIIHLSEPESGNQCLFVDLKKGNQAFRVYSMHLQSIKFQPPDYDYLDSVTHQGKTNITSFRRICSKLKLAFIKRSQQVALIKQHAQQCPYPYIFSGDFNDTPSSYAVHQLSEGLQNTFRKCGRGLGRTYNGDFPNYQIDYILVSPQFKVKSYQVVEKKLSDHYPVYSDLSLVPQPTEGGVKSGK
ncbi:endonuclease/exonuclease/phosphatase family protein [Mucilaginibacter koreensis]